MRAFMIAAFGSVVSFGLAGTALAQVVLDGSTFDALEERNPDHYFKVKEALRASSGGGLHLGRARPPRHGSTSRTLTANRLCCGPAILRSNASRSPSTVHPTSSSLRCILPA